MSHKQQANKQHIKRLLIIGLILILPTLFVKHIAVDWFFKNFKLVEIENISSYSEEARRNPFLAAEYFLKELGVDVESITGRKKLHDLPSVDDVLIVNDFVINLTPRRQAALEKWIKAGGHLITTASFEWDDKAGLSGDRLLDKHDVRLHKIEILDTVLDSVEPENDDKKNDDHNEDKYLKQKITEVQFIDREEPLKINFNSLRYLSTESENLTASAGNNSGTHLMQIELGEGLITVTSDNQFLKNFSINNYDHALYLWLLAGKQTKIQQGKIWLLYSSEMPSLLQLIWKKAHYATISAIAFIIILFWSLWYRLGPAIKPNSNHRRNIMEHLHASANFYMQQDKAESLLNSTRNHIENAWVKKNIVLKDMDQAARIEWIAEYSNQHQEAIHKALYAPANNERDFIKITANLQTLWKML